MKAVMSLVLVALVAGLVGTSYGGELTMRRQHSTGIPLAPAHVVPFGDATDQSNGVLVAAAVAAVVVVAVLAVEVAVLAPKVCPALQPVYYQKAPALSDSLGGHSTDVLFDVGGTEVTP